MPIDNQKPRVFIGSSGEAKDKLKLSSVLESLNSTYTDIEFYPWWTPGGWSNLESIMESLSSFLGDFNYSIFVCFPDDKITYRGQKKYQTRDNVTFEFGLFYSIFGKKRTFLLMPDMANFRFLTDANGLIRHQYKCTTNFLRSGFTVDQADFEGKIGEIAKSIDSNFKEQKLKASSTTNATTEQRKRYKSFQKFSSSMDSAKNRTAYFTQAIRRYAPSLTLWRAVAKGRTFEEEIEDLERYYENVDDILNVGDLEKRQSYKSHTANQLKEVWVFSEEPIEFTHVTGPRVNSFQKIKQCVVGNVKNNIFYRYFISDDVSVSNSVETTMKSVFAEIDDSIVKSLVVQYKIPKNHFQTFYTLHLFQDNTYEVFMSFITENRENDYFLKVSSFQAGRIKKLISDLSGQSI
jgi:Predicted nucleotide-binding protein containing TIR-like domain